MIHELKVWPEEYQLLQIGTKEFEVRKNDRNFEAGDSLNLREWDPKTALYTGRWMIRRISYMIQGKFGLPEDVCVMQLR